MTPQIGLASSLPTLSSSSFPGRIIFLVAISRLRSPYAFLFFPFNIRQIARPHWIEPEPKKCTSIALPTPDLFISLCAKPACATIFQPCGFLLSQPSCRAGRAIQGLSNFSSFSPTTTDRQFATLARIISSAIPCKKTASVCPCVCSSSGRLSTLQEEGDL